MRNCAQLAETFAKVVNDPAYSQEAADMLHGMLHNLFRAMHAHASDRLHPVASEESAKGKSKAAHLLEDGEGTKKRKRNTKPKDPNAPKRPASSYILFQNEVRKELKEQHPNLSNADLLGMISEQWKHMSDEQKEASRVIRLIISFPF
jgi:hypothetical protein